MRGVFITLGRDLRPLNLFVAAGRTRIRRSDRQISGKKMARYDQNEFLLKLQAREVIVFQFASLPMSIDRVKKIYFTNNTPKLAGCTKKIKITKTSASETKSSC